MKQTINIDIEIPEGFKAIYNKVTQKIDFIKIDNKPRSWEEFCENFPIKDNERGITADSQVFKLSLSTCRNSHKDKNLCTSREDAEAFLALIQLRQLRKAWINDWEADWESDNEYKHVIQYYNNTIDITCYHHSSRPLSFPSKSMAEDFLNCFKDLIETAKILL